VYSSPPAEAIEKPKAKIIFIGIPDKSWTRPLFSPLSERQVTRIVLYNMPHNKALLIASPYGGLQGPPNDVEKMVKALGGLDFEISQCCGISATRDGILQAWRQLIDSISPEDSVVVYYSGHGGLVESVDKHDRNLQRSDLTTPWRYQFLVPVDFGERGKDDFRGILDVELSYLLRSMTDKTRNVTVILDCCHAGRMARDPGLGDTAVPKGLSRVQYHDISEHVSRLGEFGQFQQETHVEENPFAVRIAAAATSETAWEYLNARGEWCGAMTEALVSAISERSIPWRTTLLRVSELVNVRFPYQHPQVEGPSNRLHFSVCESITGVFHIRNENDSVVIQAGRISGVHEGNVYSVMPFGTKKQVVEEQLAEACVTHATAFKATAELSLNQSKASRLPDDGALAFLRHDALYKWPVALPPGFPRLEKMVQESRYIRQGEPEEDNSVLAEFRLELNVIVLRNNRGLEVATTSLNPSADETSRLLKSAEQLARAQHLLALRNETPDEVLQHCLGVEFGLVENNSHLGRIIRQDGTDSVIEDDRVYIKLVNNGSEAIHVWVFDINVVGRIARVSKSSPKGIDLPPGRHEVLGLRWPGPVYGLPVSWPKAMPRTQPLEETLLLLLTSSPVDLNHLADSLDQPPLGRTSLSKLEQLTYRISSGGSRDITIVEDDGPTRYKAIHIPFLLRPKIVSTETSA
jgi:hypothetical protein